MSKGFLDAINSLMNTMDWTIEQAMEALSVPEDERTQYAAMLQHGQETMP